LDGASEDGGDRGTLGRLDVLVAACLAALLSFASLPLLRLLSGWNSVDGLMIPLPGRLVGLGPWRLALTAAGGLTLVFLAGRVIRRQPRRRRLEQAEEALVLTVAGIAGAFLGVLPRLLGFDAPVLLFLPGALLGPTLVAYPLRRNPLLVVGAPFCLLVALLSAPIGSAILATLVRTPQTPSWDAAFVGSVPTFMGTVAWATFYAALGKPRQGPAGPCRT
jgi:hypothetical protein